VRVTGRGFTELLIFRNDTSRTWTVCIYQELSPARRFETLAWLTATAAPGEEVRLTWNATLSVVLGELGTAARRPLYVALDRVETEPGTIWRIVGTGGAQTLERAGPAPLDDQILIVNESRREASPGVAVSGAAVSFARSLPGGATAQFIIRPTIYAGLYTRMRRGEVISRAVLGPLALKFAPGATTATLQAREEGSKMVLDLRPGGIEFVTLADLEERLRRAQAGE